jgi:hypothetical protein
MQNSPTLQEIKVYSLFTKLFTATSLPILQVNPIVLFARNKTSIIRFGLNDEGFKLYTRDYEFDPTIIKPSRAIGYASHAIRVT